MQLDQAQFEALLKALDGGSQLLTPANLIALAAAFIALAALLTSYVIVRQQNRIDSRRYVAQLHEMWWSEDLDAKRHVVWTELEKWRKLGQQSPAMRYFARASDAWSVESIERRAHARVLFFFADLNRLIAHRLIDEDIAFEMFGVAQYDWFRDYFRAIRDTVKCREPDPDRRPRFVTETEEFEKRLDEWKRYHPSRREI